MKPQNIHIGLSAFNNAYWNGIFYPEGLPSSKRFATYCQHFGTYEINATFYRFPTLKSLQAWYAKSPPGFLFSVKAYKGITHFRKFNGCGPEIADFYAACREGLSDKLGPVLFQLPPSYSYSPERLSLIIQSLDPAFCNVVEFRHATWWRADVMDAMAQAGITFCSVSYPGLPEDIVVSAGKAYIRLHGIPKLFYSGYGPENLQALLTSLGVHNPDKAFIYFNNTASVEGIKDAVDFKKLVSDQGN